VNFFYEQDASKEELKGDDKNEDLGVWSPM
jgi:hypothetical protein